MAVTKLTDKNDTKTGTSGDDNIDALAGDDSLNGMAGNDTLLGNLGNDLIAGGEGNDTLDGGDGNDTLDGGTGNDTLLGGAGVDLMAGGAGVDTLNGNDGNDVLDGGVGIDKLYGDAGNDFLYGGTGFDTLNGGIGDDYLFGGVENDTLYGGSGSDLLEGGDGADILADTNDIKTYGTVSTEHDELIGGLGADTFYGGYDTLWGNDGNDIFNVKNQGTVYGGTGDDKITLTNANATLDSWLEGGLGSDTLISGSGNDTLFSGYGADTLKGGGGDDNYVMTFDNMDDTLTEKPNEGTDTVYYIRDFKDDGRDDDKDAAAKELDPPSTPALPYNYAVTLDDNIENGVLDDHTYVIVPQTALITYTVAWLSGNALNNTLQGSSLKDILDGDSGNDTINAGDGDDVIFTSSGTDSIDGGIGRDLIASSVNFNLSTQATAVEDIDLLDFGTAKTATGTDGNNLLIGNKFDNSLNGGAGDDTLDGWYYSPFYAPAFGTDATLKTTGIDTLKGGAGNDLYRIDSVEDKIIESATTGGVDTVEFKSNANPVPTGTIYSYVLPDGIENLKMLDTYLQEADGNHLNNRIIGSTAANILKGGYGDDYLDGSTGIDSYEGGYGDDTFLVDNLSEIIKENAGQGNDWVQSDKVNLDLSAQTNWGVDIENARLTGTGNWNVTGRETNNALIGNTGINVLNGGDGRDTLEGGLGNDTYVVDSTTDTLIEVTNVTDTATGKIKTGWIDTVVSGATFDMAKLFNFENLTLNGSNAINGTGNINANEITGNGSANTLTGLAGNDILDGAGGLDTLIGGAGNDTYRLSGDSDVIKELANDGVDTIEIQNTFSLASDPSLDNIENLTLGGTLAIDGTGTNGGNVLTGNSANNVLTGLNGADTLIGQNGADTLIGGAGTDILNLDELPNSKDVVRFAPGDSKASANEADKIIKFAPLYDALDLAGAIKVAPTSAAVDGEDIGSIKSHKIDNGIIKFDDLDSFVTFLPISASNNLSDAIAYLKLNITDKSTVAFQVGTNDWWVFQDAGATTDTLINLVGVSGITSLSTGAFSSAAIHIE